jgi:cell wall-associated NlpC family hydrolase
MLLASVVLVLLVAHPPLSASTLKARLDRREAHPARFEVLRPSKRDSIVTVAWALIGEPYELGGNSIKRGFDCSGLVSFVLSKVQLNLPRTAKQQALVGAPIGRDRLQPGDLLTFGAGKKVSHVGIYVGDGKFVHASSIAGRVIVSPLDRPPSRLIRPLSGARRVLAIADSVAERKGGG